MEVNRKSALCKIKCKGFFAHSHLFSDAARQKRMPQKMSPNADAVSGYGPAGNGNRVGGKHSSSTEKSPLRKKYLPPHTQHHKSSGIYSYFFQGNIHNFHQNGGYKKELLQVCVDDDDVDGSESECRWGDKVMAMATMIMTMTANTNRTTHTP